MKVGDIVLGNRHNNPMVIHAIDGDDIITDYFDNGLLFREYYRTLELHPADNYVILSSKSYNYKSWHYYPRDNETVPYLQSKTELGLKIKVFFYKLLNIFNKTK